MRRRYSYLKIRRLRDMGHSWRSIAEIMGCCKETVRRALTDDIDGFKAKVRERVERLRNGPEKEENDIVGKITKKISDIPPPLSYTDKNG